MTMSSSALSGLQDGISEVRDLQAANPTPPGGLPSCPQVVRAINRASVVLLCSHFERYLRNVNEEAVAVVNQAVIRGAALPDRLRLQHSRIAIEELCGTSWENRADKLAELVKGDGWLWGDSPRAGLEHERLLRWMRSPLPKRIKRFFELWGVTDVFSRVTRQAHTRQRMWLRLQELVEKRNDIAHGEAGTEATYQDISSYITTVHTFCKRADGVLGRTLSQRIGTGRPW